MLCSAIGVRNVPGVSRPTSPLAQPRRVAAIKRGQFTKVHASRDFDEILMETANKFEKADNKGAIIGWSLAAFSAITTAEWLIHLPLFDFLLGGPIQLLGLLTAAKYGLRYYRGDKVDPIEELEGFVNNVSKELPGIGK